MQMYDNQPLPDKGGDELAADHTTQQHEQRHGTDKCMAFAVKKDALLAEIVITSYSIHYTKLYE